MKPPPVVYLGQNRKLVQISPVVNFPAWGGSDLYCLCVWRQSTDREVTLSIKLCARWAVASSRATNEQCPDFFLFFFLLQKKKTLSLTEDKAELISKCTTRGGKKQKCNTYFALGPCYTISKQLLFHISKPSNTPTVRFWKCLKCYKYHFSVKDTQVFPSQAKPASPHSILDNANVGLGIYASKRWASICFVSLEN